MSAHYNTPGEIRELQPRLIIKFLIAQVNFPHAREIGPTTIAKWMKAMDTGHSDNKLNKLSGPILRHLCAAASGEDEVEIGIEVDDEESEFAGFSHNHGHINGYEEGGPLPTRDDCISLLDDAEQTVLEPSATTSPSLTSRMDKEETGE